MLASIAPRKGPNQKRAMHHIGIATGLTIIRICLCVRTRTERVSTGTIAAPKPHSFMQRKNVTANTQCY